MFRFLMLFFVFTLSFYGTQAQVKKYLITFKNKAFNTHLISAPNSYLSAKAIAKRVKYNIAIDSADLPLTKRYVDSIKTVPNITILGHLKWSNSLVIATNNLMALTRIQQFNFVLNFNSVNRQLPIGFGALSANNKILPNVFDANSVRTTELFNYGNGLNQVSIHNGSYLHEKGLTGAGILFGVLDNGFNTYLNHSAIDSARLQNRIIETYDFVANETSVNEDGQHGLNCFSLIAANKPGTMVGTAPHANFALYRTEDDAGEMPIEEINWAMAAERADSVGVDIISSSLGYYDFDNAIYNYTPAQMDGKTTYASKAAAIAARKGMLVVVSAGNEGNNAWQFITTPSDGDSVLCIAACGFNRAIATFSSKGIPSQNRIKPNVTSMGVANYIARPNNTFGFGNGTSYACPNLAGLAGCLWQAFPQFNNIKIFDAIQRSADKFNNPDLSFGYGIPDFKKAFLLLKKEENTINFGANWLVANPNPFIDTIGVKFISQITGAVTIQLLDPNNMVLFTNNIMGSEQDWATTKFLNLNNLPAGNYTVKYSDANGNTKSVTLNKVQVPFKDWLIVFPNAPANAATQIRLQAQNTGQINLQLLDAKGSLLETKTIQATAGATYLVNFAKIANLPKGIYYINVLSANGKRVVSFLK